jgi:YhcH/YjgK/YiaL family protein
MILDTLDQHPRYHRLHPGFRAAFEFLTRPDLSELPTGRHEIDGTCLYVALSEDAGRTPEAARMEAHRRYIDIQMPLAGEEQIGWRALRDCRTVSTPYDSAKDIVFFSDPADTLLRLRPGLFAVFFPEDGHMPLIGQGRIRKAVAKILLEPS